MLSEHGSWRENFRRRLRVNVDNSRGVWCNRYVIGKTKPSNFTDEGKLLITFWAHCHLLSLIGFQGKRKIGEFERLSNLGKELISQYVILCASWVKDSNFMANPVFSLNIENRDDIIKIEDV